MTAAINYALVNGRKSVTLVHKGNIMKFTEGAFRDWGYGLATRDYRDKVSFFCRCKLAMSKSRRRFDFPPPLSMTGRN